MKQLDELISSEESIPPRKLFLLKSNNFLLEVVKKAKELESRFLRNQS